MSHLILEQGAIMQSRNQKPLRGFFYALTVSSMFLLPAVSEASDHDECKDFIGANKEICNGVMDIWDKVVAISGRVTRWTKDQWDDSLVWIEGTWDAVETGTEQTIGFLAAETNKTLEQVNNNVTKTGQDVLDRIEIGIQDIKFHVEYEASELMAFIGGSADGCSVECSFFREDLLAFLTQAEDLSNTLITFRGSGQEFAGSVDVSLIPPVDYAGLNNLIENAPGSTLYPIFRAFKTLDQKGAGEDSILVAVTEMLYLTDTTVQQLQDAVRAPAVYVWADEPVIMHSLQSEQTLSNQFKLDDGDEDDDEPATFCRALQKSYEPVEGATVRHVYDAVLPWVQASGLLLKLIGNTGDAISHTIEAHAAASAGWVAEGEIHIKGSRARTFFKILVTIGDYSLDIAALVSGDLLSCDTQIIHANTFKMHAKQDYIVCILENPRGGARAVDDCEDKKTW